MKKSRAAALSVLMMVAVMSIAFLTGCGSKSLSSDFKESEVKKAAVNVIKMINNRDSVGLKGICNATMKQALTDDVLNQVYEAIGEGGQFEKVDNMNISGSTDRATKEEYAVVVAKAKYKNRTFVYTISFTKQMKLAGLYYK